MLQAIVYFVVMFSLVVSYYILSLVVPILLIGVLIIVAYTRTRLRDQYGIDGHSLEDTCAALCVPCTVLQMARHTSTDLHGPIVPLSMVGRLPRRMHDKLPDSLADHKEMV